jgi:LysR family transcriptional regulator, regulator for bpeEF and oprC
MGHLEAIKIFTQVAETSSFSKAAELMDMPRATVSRTIQALEQRLGVRLISRNTRQVSLTEAGRAYYGGCVKVLSDLSEVETELMGTRPSPGGIVKVGTLSTIARVLILPLLDEFFYRYPDVDVRVCLADRNIDLIQEGVDCVLRMGALQDSNLIARRIGNAKLVTCASPAYLEKHGEPQCLGDLNAHLVVNYISARSGKLLPLEFNDGGQSIKLSLKSKFATDEGMAYIDAGLSGLGIIQPSRYFVADYLKQGMLREVLSDFRCPPIPLSLVYPHRRNISHATRAFTNWITEICHANTDLI